MEPIAEKPSADSADTMLALIKSKQAEIAQRNANPAIEASQKVDTKSITQAAELSDAEQRVVDQLAARDREVRDHEQAHARVGGAYASQPSYEYQTGPDGQRYAVGGEVQIDVAPIANDPEATIAKMIIVKAAALAPAEPSSADRQVASLAEATRMQAQADLMSMKAAERRGEQIDMRA